MQKCPVCKAPIHGNDSECEVCGFDQLHRVFVTEVDAEQWISNTVLPCRSVWLHMHNGLEEMKTEIEKYRSLYIEKLQENLDILKEHMNLLEIQRKYFSNDIFQSDDELSEFLSVDDDNDGLPF